jgi:hypothetical protein
MCATCTHWPPSTRYERKTQELDRLANVAERAETTDATAKPRERLASAYATYRAMTEAMQNRDCLLHGELPLLFIAAEQSCWDLLSATRSSTGAVGRADLDGWLDPNQYADWLTDRDEDTYRIEVAIGCGIAVSQDRRHNPLFDQVIENAYPVSVDLHCWFVHPAKGALLRSFASPDEGINVFQSEDLCWDPMSIQRKKRLRELGLISARTGELTERSEPAPLVISEKRRQMLDQQRRGAGHN